MNRWSDVEHGRNHWITGHWCIPLTNARSLTDNDDERQGAEYILPSVNKWFEVEPLGKIYQSGDIDEFPLSIARKPATKDCKFQGTTMSLILIPEDVLKLMGWDPLEGGPWWFPHQPTWALNRNVLKVLDCESTRYEPQGTETRDFKDGQIYSQGKQCRVADTGLDLPWT